MATPAEVASLRALIDDTGDPPEFTSVDLGAYIDEAGGDIRQAAGAVWGVKASRLAGLVDVQEGASSRKLGQLYKQALEMATFYGAKPASASTTGRSGTRPIVRQT